MSPGKEDQSPNTQSALTLQISLDRLYGAALADFVSLRREIVRDLRSKSLHLEAAVVAGSKKPSVPAWILNQISRRYPKQLEWLFEANQKLAQAMTPPSESKIGSKNVLRYQEASRARREIIKQLLDSAGRILEQSGFRATTSILNRLSDALFEVGSGGELADLLQKGRLTNERPLPDS